MKFNKVKSKTQTVNKAGGRAFKQTDKLEFVSILLTSFLGKDYYREGNETMERIAELLQGLKDKKFAAKAAIYARTKFGMRSVSHVVAADLADSIAGEPWAKNFYNKVINRPDDVLEILARYHGETGKNFTHAMRKGFAVYLGALNEYKLAKYRGEGKDFSMVDTVNLIHPKATDALKKLITSKLKPAETWEAKLTKAGQVAKDEEEKQELKADAWKELVSTGKIGYFALLRNLRNIIQQAPDMLDKALKMLVDKDLIKTSLVLPFRFQTAYGEIEQLKGVEARKTLSALNDALDLACSNAPKFDGETLVVLDDSGSMGNAGIDSKEPFAIGSLFASVLVKSNNCDFMMFSDEARYLTLNAKDSVTSLIQKMDSNRKSAGTNFQAIFPLAGKTKYDRVIILSDMQGWMAERDGYFNIGGAPTKQFEAYKKLSGANPKIYSFDLRNYGTMQFPQAEVYAIAGFSDKIFDVMKLLETDKNALINTIEAIEL